VAEVPPPTDTWSVTLPTVSRAGGVRMGAVQFDAEDADGYHVHAVIHLFAPVPRLSLDGSLGSCVRALRLLGQGGAILPVTLLASDRSRGGFHSNAGVRLDGGLYGVVGTDCESVETFPGDGVASGYVFLPNFRTPKEPAGSYAVLRDLTLESVSDEPLDIAPPLPAVKCLTSGHLTAKLMRQNGTGVEICAISGR
jgi:hypothetical protein